MIDRSRVRISAGAAGEFSSPEVTSCADSYSEPMLPRVTAVARKRVRSFCNKCRWQDTPKHACTLDPTKSEWCDHAGVQASCGNLSGNELTFCLSENIQPQSSQLAEPLWTDPGIKSGISVRELIFTSKKKKRRRRGINGRTFSQNPHKRVPPRLVPRGSNILPKSSQARKSPPGLVPWDLLATIEFIQRSFSLLKTMVCECSFLPNSLLLACGLVSWVSYCTVSISATAQHEPRSVDSMSPAVWTA